MHSITPRIQAEFLGHSPRSGGGGTDINVPIKWVGTPRHKVELWPPSYPVKCGNIQTVSLKKTLKRLYLVSWLFEKSFRKKKISSRSLKA